MEFVKAVVTFNQQVLGIEQRSPVGMALSEEDITIRCLHEEVSELEEAFESDSVVDQIDALVDLVYFAFGAMYKIGLTPEQIHACCMAVHEANITKKRGTNAKRDTGAADAVKPEGWVPPEDRLQAIIFGKK